MRAGVGAPSRVPQEPALQGRRRSPEIHALCVRITRTILGNIASQGVTRSASGMLIGIDCPERSIANGEPDLRRTVPWPPLPARSGEDRAEIPRPKVTSLNWDGPNVGQAS